MSKLSFLVIMALVNAFAGCAGNVSNHQVVVMDNHLSEGFIRIKVSPGMSEKIECGDDKRTVIELLGLSDYFDDDSTVIRIERTFPYAGEFEKNLRDRGLNLWYDIYQEKKR